MLVKQQTEAGDTVERTYTYTLYLLLNCDTCLEMAQSFIFNVFLGARISYSPSSLVYTSPTRTQTSAGKSQSEHACNKHKCKNKKENIFLFMVLVLVIILLVSPV